jgi:hypothetical protein
VGAVGIGHERTIVLSLDRVPAVGEALCDPIDRPGIGQDEPEPRESLFTLWALAAVVPGVDSEVMMVLPRCEKRGSVTIPCLHAEAEPLGVELLRSVEIDRLEVDVTDRRLGGHGSSGEAIVIAIADEVGFVLTSSLLFSSGRECRELTEIERAGIDVDPAVVGSGPLLSRAIVIEFDAVAGRITQVQRLADVVIRRPREFVLGSFDPC